MYIAKRATKNLKEYLISVLHEIDHARDFKKMGRKFIDKYITTKNIGACSQNDIIWKERGFFKQGLEMLCIWHGFYYAAHRAMNDVNAMIHLLSYPSYKSN